MSAIVTQKEFGGLIDDLLHGVGEDDLIEMQRMERVFAHDAALRERADRAEATLTAVRTFCNQFRGRWSELDVVEQVLALLDAPKETP
jgi:hypothetical protein